MKISVKCNSDICPADGSCYREDYNWGGRVQQVVYCVHTPKNMAYFMPPGTYEDIGG